jgi:alkanesulfonate monooxygenase SsuD/methylene tetrahydromethanopterin reductase-like flavin-dependent oxidoreductase (luciferase family)
VGLAEAAERGGWDGFFLWDHLHFVRAMQLDIVDPFVTLGAIAHATSRLRIGAMVTPLPRRRPWKLAKEIVTLDHLSAGRVVVGVGLGFPPDDEFAAFGEPSDDATRAALLDEGLVVLDGCLRGGGFRHRGPAYNVDVDLHPAPIQRPRPPIWAAAMLPNRRPIARAQRLDGLFPIAASGDLLQPADIADLVAELDVRPGFDVVAAWADGVPAAEYEAAGATWLVDSRWPEGEWFEELAEAAARGPV